MTIIDIREKYERADKLKPAVEEILKENQEGLNFHQILRKLEELEKYYKEIEEDLRVLLQSGGFEINKRKKRRIYKILNS
jgi:hypothetical protein